MESAPPLLLSDAAIQILNEMKFNPHARGRFEQLSGGLMWSDEFPPLCSAEWAEIEPGYLYRYLLAYRATITLEQGRSRRFEHWEQVARDAPHWPGLRPKRRGERAKRRLQAALRLQDRRLAKLESEQDLL